MTCFYRKLVLADIFDTKKGANRPDWLVPFCYTVN